VGQDMREERVQMEERAWMRGGDEMIDR